MQQNKTNTKKNPNARENQPLPSNTMTIMMMMVVVVVMMMKKQPDGDVFMEIFSSFCWLYPCFVFALLHTRMRIKLMLPHIVFVYSVRSHSHVL
jgi:hypothetical protein